MVASLAATAWLPVPVASTCNLRMQNAVMATAFIQSGMDGLASGSGYKSRRKGTGMFTALWGMLDITDGDGQC